MSKFLTRTISGAVYVLLILLAIYGGKLTGNNVAGSIIFSVIFFIIAMIGCYEVVHNLTLSGKIVNNALAYAIAATTMLILFPFNMESGLSLVAPMVILLPFIVMIAQLWRQDEKPFATIGYTLLPTLWVVIPILFLSYIHYDSPGLAMMIFILIWVNDSFAYMTGMLLGKHKMWERHSPGKTWEGTVGGFVFCILTAVFIGPLFTSAGDTIQSSLGWAIIGIICSVFGTLGDLVESMFKRSCGVKDSGNIMPGHGGVLDRFDSILMTTPFVFVLWFTVHLLLNL